MGYVLDYAMDTLEVVKANLDELHNAEASAAAPGGIFASQDERGLPGVRDIA